MDIYVLDKHLERVGIVDDAISAIWTPRYSREGDFEIEAAACVRNLELLSPGNRLARANDDMVGIVRSVEIKTDADNGDVVIAKGPDLKAVLGQRIVWGQVGHAGPLSDFLRRLVSENAVDPLSPSRKIPGLRIGSFECLGDVALEVQVTGGNLAEIISSYCSAFSAGWRVRLDGREMVVECYKGLDRTDRQSLNNRVTFSSAYDNLASTNYLYDGSGFRNSALVAGEGEGSARKLASVGAAAGLDRYECFVDARDLSSDTDDGPLTPEQYSAALEARGSEKLVELAAVESYDGEVQHDVVFEYGRDYYLGDVVNVVNRLGVSGYARIVETIECEDAEGRRMVPVFEDWEVAR